MTQTTTSGFRGLVPETFPCKFESSEYHPFLCCEDGDLTLQMVVQAGLLNVLDGVVDCPNRIVVLTVCECVSV